MGDQLRFHYGNPEDTGSWDQAASVFAAHDSVNSERTSSLPLVQFWKPKGKARKLNSLAKALLKTCVGNSFNVEDVEKLLFEYPVPVNKEPKCKGKASMTDLMIISKSHAIAIEAKWTECKEKYESISEWKKEGKDETNRNNVLKGWIKYINAFVKSEVLETENLGEYAKIPYQLLHRIASACAVAQQQGKSEAIVIYQLFYDSEGCVSKGEMKSFAKGLAEHYGNLFKRLKKVRFYLALVETKINQSPKLVEILNRVTDKDRSSLNDIFVLMQTEDVYEFSVPITILT